MKSATVSQSMDNNMIDIVYNKGDLDGMYTIQLSDNITYSDVAAQQIEELWFLSSVKSMGCGLDQMNAHIVFTLFKSCDWSLSYRLPLTSVKIVEKNTIDHLIFLVQNMTHIEDKRVIPYLLALISDHPQECIFMNLFTETITFNTFIRWEVNEIKLLAYHTHYKLFKRIIQSIRSDPCYDNRQLIEKFSVEIILYIMEHRRDVIVDILQLLDGCFEVILQTILTSKEPEQIDNLVSSLKSVGTDYWNSSVILQSIETNSVYVEDDYNTLKTLMNSHNLVKNKNVFDSYQLNTLFLLGFLNHTYLYKYFRENKYNLTRFYHRDDVYPLYIIHHFAKYDQVLGETPELSDNLEKQIEFEKEFGFLSQKELDIIFQRLEQKQQFKTYISLEDIQAPPTENGINNVATRTVELGNRLSEMRHTQLVTQTVLIVLICLLILVGMLRFWTGL